MPDTGGPATHASMGTPPDPPAAMTRSMPPHEMANVRAKKLRSGCLLIRALTVFKMSSFLWLEIPSASVCYKGHDLP